MGGAKSEGAVKLNFEGWLRGYVRAKYRSAATGTHLNRSLLYPKKVA